ncbi:hypothetical protein D0Z06_24800 [Geodermatophilus marinus]|nr:hypothetical protein D0Z06_24800 [Geodermatophilus sp. LHW52908]
MTSTRSASVSNPGAARSGRAAPRPAALLEAALGGLGGLRRCEQRGELGWFGAGHAGLPFVGDDGQRPGAGVSALLGRHQAELAGAR